MIFRLTIHLSMTRFTSQDYYHVCQVASQPVSTAFKINTDAWYSSRKTGEKQFESSLRFTQDDDGNNIIILVIDDRSCMIRSDVTS